MIYEHILGITEERCRRATASITGNPTWARALRLSATHMEREQAPELSASARARIAAAQERAGQVRERRRLFLFVANGHSRQPRERDAR